MDGNVSLSTLGLLLGAFGFVALTVSFFWYYRQTGGQKAQAQALENYKSLADSEEARANAAEKRVQVLAVQVEKVEAERDAALRDANECAQENLRLWARMGKLEKAFNSLERRFNLPETNFDDPGGSLHRTDTPERQH